MEACCLAKSGCLRLPSSSRKHPMLLVVLDLARAMLTNVLGTLGFAPRPAQLRKFESLKLLAMGAWHLIVALVAIFERRLNATRSGNLRGGDHKDFPPRDGSRSGQRDVARVTFPIHVSWISIHLVKEQIARRHRAQSDRTVGSRHDENAAWKLFGEHGIRSQHSFQGRE